MYWKEALCSSQAGAPLGQPLEEQGVHEERHPCLFLIHNASLLSEFLLLEVSIVLLLC